MPEETHMLIIEGADENTVNITLLNLAIEGHNGPAAMRDLLKNDPEAVVIALIPENTDIPDVIVEAVRAGARAYIKKPASGGEAKRCLVKMLERSEEK
jgi:DNA-binding NarL/FixJ family response regulator